MRYFDRINRWLWLPASGYAVLGIFGLADLVEATWAGKVLLVTPHVAGIVWTAFAEPSRPLARAVALVGTAVMAALSWEDRLSRETEGFEWRFNNSLSGAMCCGANWFVLLLVSLIILLLPARRIAVEQRDESQADGPRDV